jgi:dihydrofolate reductase
MKVFIIAAITADGFIGLDSSQSSLDWRSKEDGRFFSERTKEAGVMVMGSVTYKTFRIKRAPPGRRLIVLSRNPQSITGDGIEAVNEEPELLLKRLEREGANEIAICGGSIIHKLFLEKGLVDELYLTIEPVLFGSGINLLGGRLNLGLALINIQKLNKDTLLAHYSIKQTT